MNAEIESIERKKNSGSTNKQNQHRCKWIYITKLNEKKNIKKNKGRLVSIYFFGQLNIDYAEAFSPVARLDIVRTLLAIAAKRKWQVFQLGVNSTFLNGILKEKVYV